MECVLGGEIGVGHAENATPVFAEDRAVAADLSMGAHVHHGCQVNTRAKQTHPTPTRPPIHRPAQRGCACLPLPKRGQSWNERQSFASPRS